MMIVDLEIEWQSSFSVLLKKTLTIEMGEEEEEESIIHRTIQTTVEPIENDLDNHMDRRIMIFFISKP